MNLPRSRSMLFLGGLFVVLLVVEILAVAVSAIRLRTEKRALKARYGQLEQLQRRKPYPSEVSVKTLRKNVDELEYRMVEFRAEMRRDPFPREHIDAAEFSARAQRVIEQFRQRAALMNIVLPESLEAGFSEYASGGAVPDARHVPRLTRELYSMERVVNVLLQSGVTSVDDLSRDVFEREAEDLPANRRRPQRTSGGPSGTDRPERSASEVDREGLYDIEHIGVTFTGSEQAVWQVMERMASAPHFMAVSSFAHDTQTRIMRYDPEAVVKGGEEDTKRFLKEGMLTGESALSRPERIISGNDPIKVNLVLDVYSFLPGPEVP